MAERDSGGGASLSVGALRREPRGRAPLLETLEDRKTRFCRWMSVSIGAPLGNLEGGLSTGDFDRWLKGAVGMERFPMKRLSALQRVSGDGSFTGDPGRYVKEGSGYGHLSAYGPHRGTWRGFAC